MEHIVLISIVLFVAGLSFLLTIMIKNYAIKKQINDIPNERSSHSVPVPRLGGIAINAVWFPAISLLFYLDYIPQNLYFALLSGLLIAIVSMIDDLYGLGFLIRLIIHFGAVILAFYFLGGLRHFITFDIHFDYPFITYPIFIVGMVWFINLFNFMDGLDGFASTEAISIAVVLFIFTGSPVLIILIASIAGFLYWNWPKAKIFMGDTGSTQLGFILIVLGLHFHNILLFSILNWIMIAAPFWFDATYTLYRRWSNGESISQAHRKHAYQRLTKLGLSHLQVNWILIAMNLMILSMVFIYRGNDLLKIPLTISTIIAMYLLYKELDKKVPF